MRFDVFHSLGRIDSLAPRLADKQVFAAFFRQVQAAEELGYGTIWVAESHFSSEVQKRYPGAVIPHYQGEVGLNCDSMQLAQLVLERTRRIGFGTAIMNIVGGNGGPIAAADRVRMLAWYNALRDTPRQLDIGVATGRFPYINKPFGIVPRTAEEEALWPQYQQLIFVEALEIFLRLLNDETLSSSDLTKHEIGRALFKDDAAFEAAQWAVGSPLPRPYAGRWSFAPLKLVPDMAPAAWKSFLRIVLGSHDPMARDHALRFGDLDVFNLSFTPPAAIEAMHATLRERYAAAGKVWARQRMPRTVLVFIDDDPRVARERASACFDTYMEAMRGTAKFPPKEELMARALIGDASMIREQLAPGASHGFATDDRLMLWFEFNQTDGDAIERQMRQFAERVLPHFT